MAYGNKCYWFNSGSDNTVSWYDTIDLCGELSAEPATIQNTYEQVEYLFVLHSNMKSNLLLYSLYYAEACSEFARPISASLRPGNIALFEEMSLLWRAVGITVLNLRPSAPETNALPLDHLVVLHRVSLSVYFNSTTAEFSNRFEITTQFYHQRRCSVGSLSFARVGT